MIEFSQDQLERLNELEQRQFVVEVARQVKLSYPDLAGEEGLADRLQEAHDYCKAIGFHSGEAITQFLFYEAIAPSFYRAQAVQTWLTRPNYSPEQRFSDLRSAARIRLEEF